MAKSTMAKKEPMAHKEMTPDHHMKMMKHHMTMMHKMAKHGHKHHESKKEAKHHEHMGMEKKERGPVKKMHHKAK
jgi:hypothetical protein